MSANPVESYLEVDSILPALINRTWGTLSLLEYGWENINKINFAKPSTETINDKKTLLMNNPTCDIPF